MEEEVEESEGKRRSRDGKVNGEKESVWIYRRFGTIDTELKCGRS